MPSNVFFKKSFLFVGSIMLLSYYSTDTIRGLLEVINGYPGWVPLSILLAILAAIWYGMEHLTKRK